MTGDISRRTWLRTVGLTTVGLSLAGSGTAAAKPDHAKGNGSGKKKEDKKEDKKEERENGSNGSNGGSAKNECPEGTTLLAKYEVDDSGKVVFEKGRDSLNIDGSEIRFSNIVYKEDGEIVSFDWDSGPYDVHTVSVKAGQNIWQDEVKGTSGRFDLREFDTDGPVQAVSNVIFCIEVCWQLDFGRGDIPIPPNYSPNRTNDLFLSASCERVDVDRIPNNPGLNRIDPDDPVVVKPVDGEVKFDLSTPGTATIYFEVKEGEMPDLHLACFEIPGPFIRDEVGAQVLFDSIEKDNVAPGHYEWTVDLPTL